MLTKTAIPKITTFKLAALLLASFAAAEAGAHARWSMDGSTPGRTDDANIKSGPCGGYARTNNPVEFVAGSTVTLNWESTIDHEGYFIISFSPEGDKDFEQHVLLDNIPEREVAGAYSAEVTLPSEPCENCTLQMIQVMLDRSPPSKYFSCADIRLIADPQVDDVPPVPVTSLSITGEAPVVAVTWQNPNDDFAGALVVRGGDAPVSGTAYQVGDIIGSSRVAYVGAVPKLDLTDAQSLESIYVYAFDLTQNYSASESKTVASAIELAPLGVSLNQEQIGQPNDAEVYAADGEVQLTALVAFPTDDMALTWSGNVIEKPNQKATFDPEGLAGQSIEVSVTVIDPTPAGDREEASIARFDVKPYSYYQPVYEFIQNGQVVSEFITEDGTAEVRIVFSGAKPANFDDWRVEWQHDIAGATVEHDRLVFEPEGKTSQDIRVQVHTTTAPAAPEMSLRAPVVKPIKLGNLGLFSVFLMAALLFVRQRLQARA